MRTRTLGLALASCMIGMAAYATQGSTPPVPNLQPGASGPPVTHRNFTPPGNPGGSAPVTTILVYDNNTNYQFAQQAAFNIDAGGTVVATSVDFDTLLGSQSWDIVAVDCPSTIPVGGWGALIAYVNSGGVVVMSFWDWDNNSGLGDPNLPPAFEVAVAADMSLTGQTLYDSGTSTVFNGVTMPNSDWASYWVDDGDEFDPIGSAYGLGHIGNIATPVLVHGNAGRTIAAFAIDEAGTTWVSDGSGVQLWENMMGLVGGCATPASCTWYCGTGVNIACDGFVVTAPPVLGGALTASVTGVCGPQGGAMLAGYSAPLSGFMLPWGELLIDFTDPNGELLGFPTSLGDPAVFVLPVPNNPSWCGLGFYVQAVGFGSGIVMHCAWQCVLGI